MSSSYQSADICEADLNYHFDQFSGSCTCKQGMALGEVCDPTGTDPDMQCAERTSRGYRTGLVCSGLVVTDDDVSDEAVCHRESVLGGLCDSDSDCAAGFCNVNSTCATDVMSGGSCAAAGAACPVGEFCHANTCTPFKGVGEECGNTDQCRTGTMCNTHADATAATCVIKFSGAVGDGPFSSNDFCKSGLRDIDGLCAALPTNPFGLAEGSDCDQMDECESGFCKCRGNFTGRCGPAPSIDQVRSDYWNCLATTDCAGDAEQAVVQGSCFSKSCFGYAYSATCVGLTVEAALAGSVPLLPAWCPMNPASTVSVGLVAFLGVAVAALRNL